MANIEIEKLQRQNSTISQFSSNSSKSSSLSWRIKGNSQADHLQLPKPIAEQCLPFLPNTLFSHRSEHKSSERFSQFYHQERFLLPRPRQQSRSCACKDSNPNQNARLVLQQVQHHSRQLFQEVAEERIVNGMLRQDCQRHSSSQRSGHTKRNETASRTENPKTESVDMVFCFCSDIPLKID